MVNAGDSWCDPGEYRPGDGEAQGMDREPLATLPLSPWMTPPEAPSLSDCRVDLWRFRLDPVESELPGLTLLLCPAEQQRAC